MKRQPTDWEKIFANEVTNKRLVSKIYKQLMILNSIKTNGQKTQTFLQRKHTDSQETHEIMFTMTNY